MTTRLFRVVALSFAMVVAGLNFGYAQATTSTQVIPIGLLPSSYDACADDTLVSIGGSAQGVIHQTLLPSGFVMFSVNLNIQGEKVVGQSSGIIYQVSQNLHQKFALNPSSQVQTQSIHNSLRLISRGNAPNLVMRMKTTIKIDFSTNPATVTIIENKGTIEKCK